jgi:hypothetical protein
MDNLANSFDNQYSGQDRFQQFVETVGWPDLGLEQVRWSQLDNQQYKLHNRYNRFGVQQQEA